jgi:hypothetical protein
MNITLGSARHNYRMWFTGVKTVLWNLDSRTGDVRLQTKSRRAVTRSVIRRIFRTLQNMFHSCLQYSSTFKTPLHPHEEQGRERFMNAIQWLPNNTGCLKKIFTMVFQMLRCGECYENVQTIQGVERWIACAPLSVNVFVTLDIQ